MPEPLPAALRAGTNSRASRRCPGLIPSSLRRRLGLVLFIALAAVATVAALPGVALADVPIDWIDRTVSTGPAPRIAHGMAYDEVRKQTVMFGGRISTGVASDTWAWDGQGWVEHTNSEHPPGRADLGMTFDARRERVVLFGGRLIESPESFSDTWEWDGDAWSERSPLVSPPARDNHALAYDPSRGRTVLFGGSVGADRTDPLGDTWEWDGSEWHQISTSASPPPRSRHALAYAGDGRVILFGGVAVDSDGAQQVLNDTWLWDGETWIQSGIDTAPPPRHAHSMAYDADREQVVLFGGIMPLGNGGTDTWVWDTGRWTPLATDHVPPSRRAAAMAYDSDRRRTVLFAGGDFNPGWITRSDTWELGRPTTLAYIPLSLQQVARGDLPKNPPLPDLCAHALGGPPGSAWDSILDLSAAHAGIRFFGPGERYSKVDQALLGAFERDEALSWPSEPDQQARFLATYAAELSDVCGLPSGPALSEADVRVEGSIAIVRPGTGAVRLPSDIEAVAVDLRNLPAAAELPLALEAAVSPALKRSVPRSPYVVRWHGGMQDEVVTSNSIYNNGSTLRAATPITATGDSEMPLVLITDDRLAPAAAELAGALRLRNRAVIVGQAVVAAVAESRWNGIGQSGLIWRWRDLRHVAAPLPTRWMRGLSIGQADCSDWNSAMPKREFTTSTTTARVTVSLTGTLGISETTSLILGVFYDRNANGELESPDEYLGSSRASGVGASASVTVEELLPAGRWQVRVLSCDGAEHPRQADVSVVVHPGHRWPDLVPADINSSDPVRHLSDAVRLASDIQAVPPGRTTRRTIEAVDSYDDRQPAGIGHAERRAALVTQHGAYRLFYPYPETYDAADARLVETVNEANTQTPTRRSMVNSLRRLSEGIRDGHSYFYNYGSKWFDFLLQVHLEPVDGEPVVRHSLHAEIDAGDTIVSVDGRPASDVFAEEYELTSAATDGWRFDRAALFFRQREGPTALDLRRPNGDTRSVTVHESPSGTLTARYPRQSGALTDLGAPTVYYLNLDTSVTPNATAMRAALAEAETASGLVLDLRGYPGGINQYEVVSRLITETVESPIFSIPTYEGPDVHGRNVIQYPVAPRSEPHFHGPIAVLIGPHSYSAAENVALMLADSGRATFVGQRTAATNGNVTGIQVPGGFGVIFTGAEVQFPSGARFHGVGIAPDIVAVPSAADLEAGIDRELVTAISYLPTP